MISQRHVHFPTRWIAARRELSTTLEIHYSHSSIQSCTVWEFVPHPNILSIIHSRGRAYSRVACLYTRIVYMIWFSKVMCAARSLECLHTICAACGVGIVENVFGIVVTHTWIGDIPHSNAIWFRHFTLECLRLHTIHHRLCTIGRSRIIYLLGWRFH